MSGGTVMKLTGWWRPVRRSRELADQAEADRDRTNREVTEPLRRMRRGDFLTPAITEEIRRQQHREG